MVFNKPSSREDASWKADFMNIKLSTDDDVSATEMFHDFKKRVQLTAKASGTSLILEARPAAAGDDQAKWDHYEPLLHAVLSNCVTGTQVSTVILAASNGYEAWSNLCEKNESSHNMNAVEMIFRLLTVMNWEKFSEPDPRTAVAELTKVKNRLANLTDPIDLPDALLQAILLGRYVDNENTKAYAQTLMAKTGLTYAQAQKELEAYSSGDKARLKFKGSTPTTARAAKDNGEASSSSHIARSTKQPKIRKRCTNCDRLGHEIEQCLAPGGGSEDAEKLTALLERNKKAANERREGKADWKKQPKGDKDRSKRTKSRKSRRKKSSSSESSESEPSLESESDSDSDKPQRSRRSRGRARSSRHRSRSQRHSIRRVKARLSSATADPYSGHLEPVYRWWVDLPESKETIFNLDSGNTATMKKDPRYMKKYKRFSKPEACQTAKDGEEMEIVGSGIMEAIPHAESPCKLSFQCLVTPELDENLMSVSQTVDLPPVKGVWMGNDEKSELNDSYVLLKSGNKIPVERHEGSYYVRFKTESSKGTSSAVKTTSSTAPDTTELCSCPDCVNYLPGFAHLCHDCTLELIPTDTSEPPKTTRGGASTHANLSAAKLSSKDQTELAFKRLGFPSPRVVMKTPNMNLKIEEKHALQIESITAVLGKSKRKHHPRVSKRRKDYPGARIHVDNTGPMECTSIGGAKFGTLFTDEYSSVRYYDTRRSLNGESLVDSVEQFRKTVLRGHKPYGHRLRIDSLRMDDGSDMTSAALKDYCDDPKNDIRTEYSAPRTKEQAGTAEAANDSIERPATAMLLDSKAPKPFWGQAGYACSYLKSRSALSRDLSVTPWELMYNEGPPDNSHLRRWGCVALPHVAKELRHKWDPKAQVGMLVGYEWLSGNYQIWLPHDLYKARYDRGDIVIRSDVSFLENTNFWDVAHSLRRSPHDELENHISAGDLSALNDYTMRHDSECDTVNVPISLPTQQPATCSQQPIQQPPTQPVLQPVIQPVTQPIHQTPVEQVPQQTQVEAPVNEGAAINPYPRRERGRPDYYIETGSTYSKRTAKKTVTWSRPLTFENPQRPSITKARPARKVKARRVSAIRRYKSELNTDELDKEDDDHADPVLRAWAAKVMSEGKVPKTCKEAMRCDDRDLYRKAMQDEFDMQHRKGCYKYIKRKDLPARTKIHHGMWVYRIKTDGNGNFDGVKARWVFIGSQQMRGADYDETFAPTGRPTTMRMCHAIASSLKLVARHADVEGAFLNSYISDDDISDRKIYMEQIQGFDDPNYPRAEYVLQLVKTIYGMKQANQLWWKNFSGWMVDYGFRPSEYDPCLFYGNTGKKKLAGIRFVPVIVDDISAYLDNDRRALRNYKKFIKALNETFVTKDKGPVEFYLQQNVTTDVIRDEYRVSQQVHIQKMLEKQQMDDCHSKSLPYNIGHISNVLRQGREAPTDEKSDPAINPSEYRNKTGSIGYPAVMTRPDIACTTSVLQRYQSAPRSSHETGAKHVMRYLKGTKNLGIRYTGGKIQLRAAVDASWADDVDTAESQYGWVIFLCGGVISWKSALMRCTATSTTEAEYVGLADLVCELIYLTSLLNEMGFPQEPVPVDEDNQGVLGVAKNEGRHSNQRHINIKFHLCRKYLGSVYVLKDVRGSDNVADIMTKPLLSVEKFERLRAQLLSPNSV